MATIRIATRSSRQATTQASLVASALQAEGYDTSLVLIDTHGDRTQHHNVPLHTIGGTGVFVKEVQAAVLDDRADIAVHSAKDLPTADVVGLEIGAFTRRRNPADALAGRAMHDLANGATIATGSVRRRALLARARPDLEFIELRGNIDTRLSKIPPGGSIVIAAAALELLDMTEEIAEVLDPAEFVPAVGQGCVLVEARSGEREIRSALSKIDDSDARDAVTIERAFLAELGGGCSLPVGAYCDGNRLRTFLASETGPRSIRADVEISGDLAADCQTAANLARDARDELAGEIDTAAVPPGQL